MNTYLHNAKLVSVALAVALCLPANTWPQNPGQTATQTPTSPAANQPQTSPANPQPSPSVQQPPPSGVTVNPSQPPLQPATTYPDAGDRQQPPNAPQPKTQTGQAQNEPQGAATAEKVPTAGGSAAKPAGVAIAPPKQHQTRALLIKWGAVAAGAVAAGTIYALSRGTPSTPPGANGPGAIQKRK
jgi:hypothetical protein